MSLYAEHFQYSLGDPPERAPSNFGYWVGDEHQSYEGAPFTSAAARADYEAAVVRYLTLEGVVLPVLEVPPFAVAALVVIGGAGEAADEFSLQHLAAWGITGRILDDLRLLADHTIISAIT